MFVKSFPILNKLVGDRYANIISYFLYQRNRLTGYLQEGDRWIRYSQREIAENMGLSQAVVRYRLERLCELGLVKRTKITRWERTGTGHAYKDNSQGYIVVDSALRALAEPKLSADDLNALEEALAYDKRATNDGLLKCKDSESSLTTQAVRNKSINLDAQSFTETYDDFNVGTQEMVDAVVKLKALTKTQRMKDAVKTWVAQTPSCGIKRIVAMAGEIGVDYLNKLNRAVVVTDFVTVMVSRFNGAVQKLQDDEGERKQLGLLREWFAGADKKAPEMQLWFETMKRKLEQSNSVKHAVYCYNLWVTERTRSLAKTIPMQFESPMSERAYRAILNKKMQGCNV